MVAALMEEYPRTMGADKGYDTKGVVRFMRWLGVPPMLRKNTNRLGGAAIDGRAIRHPGYR